MVKWFKLEITLGLKGKMVKLLNWETQKWRFIPTEIPICSKPKMAIYITTWSKPKIRITHPNHNPWERRIQSRLKIQEFIIQNLWHGKSAVTNLWPKYEIYTWTQFIVFYNQPTITWWSNEWKKFTFWIILAMLLTGQSVFDFGMIVEIHVCNAIHYCIILPTAICTRRSPSLICKYTNMTRKYQTKNYTVCIIKIFF